MAVFVFLKAFNDFLSSFRPTIKHCIYFSDGAPQQFKSSKHFSTIYYHKQDFDRTAIWHFQATAYGKGPCDGARGALKRQARKASLQRSVNDQITTLLQLYEWVLCDSLLSNISVAYRTEKSYNEAANFLKKRFDDCKTIPDTQKIRCVEPVANRELQTRAYSRCPTFQTISFSAAYLK